MFLEMLGLLFVFAVVLLLCFFTTKIVGRKMNGNAKNKTMKIVETLPLGLDRCLYLILVGKKYFLFFSSKKGMELVSEIEYEGNPQDVPGQENESTNIFDFRKIFDSYSGLSKSDKPDTASETEAGETKATGILGGIKRLKRMNSQRDD